MDKVSRIPKEQPAFALKVLRIPKEQPAFALRILRIPQEQPAFDLRVLRIPKEQPAFDFSQARIPSGIAGQTKRASKRSRRDKRSPPPSRLITVQPDSFAKLAGVQRVQPFGALPWKGGFGRDRCFMV
ncbi:hypothetical protein B9T62_15980 [Paenibacillus donghaensis]|uniref:Uncharacterized protein n=1 Tax=Paenibacillus donghaensis TaxID=414771 RepID=A0A2Z2K725_9BACL|nr:hypothetical protein B9T62_15980 [Paenibacillus donghaensis]